MPPYMCRGCSCLCGGEQACRFATGMYASHVTRTATSKRRAHETRNRNGRRNRRNEPSQKAINSLPTLFFPPRFSWSVRLSHALSFSHHLRFCFVFHSSPARVPCAAGIRNSETICRYCSFSVLASCIQGPWKACKLRGNAAKRAFDPIYPVRAHQMDTSVMQGPSAIREEEDSKIEQQSQEQQEQAFLAWLRSNGAVFDSLSWPSPVTGSGTRGAVARSGIATGVR